MKINPLNESFFIVAYGQDRDQLGKGTLSAVTLKKALIEAAFLIGHDVAEVTIVIKRGVKS